MRQRKASSTSRTALRNRLILWLVVLGITTGFAYAYVQRNVHHIHLSPGQSVEYRVELAMQKTFASKNFVKEMGLPVICRIKGSNTSDRVSMSIMETGHGIHRLWAKLSIHASDAAKPGRRMRLLDFTIEGRNDWPQVTVYVHVD